MTTIADQLRFAEDYGNVADCIVNDNPFEVYLVTITQNPRVRTDTRLTIADGYRSYAPNGFLNPHIRQVTAKEALQSGGRLNTKDYCLGPMVYPYNMNGITGGFDIINFDPNIKGQTTYIKLVGLDTPSTGLYCKKAFSLADNGTWYKIYLSNSGTTLPI